MQEKYRLAIDLIRAYEGFESRPYLDAVGVPTIGYGTTRYEDGRPVKLLDKPISVTRAEELLLNYLYTSNAVINDCVRPLMSPEAMAAMMSLCYNIGHAGFRSSSVVSYLNKNQKQLAADSFLLWVRGNNRTLPGLVKRRMSEMILFCKGEGLKVNLPYINVE